jgi:hypothetical protein
MAERAVSVGWKCTACNQKPAQLYTIIIIDVQNPNRCSAALAFAHKDSSLPPEMAVPILLAGVKECHNFAAHEPRQICAFAQVAVMTTPGQVGQPIVAFVFLGNDVL